MNKYITKILQQSNTVSQEKKIQYTINHLIDKYANEELGFEKGKQYLVDIQEVATYFKDQAINYSKKDDLLLRMSCFLGEKDFVQWLLKSANHKVVPNLHVELSSPLRLACLNSHTPLVEFLLTDKQIKRSQINEINGAPLATSLEKNNMEIVKLLLAQPEIDIQIEHVQTIFTLDVKSREEILTFISENEVRDKFFDRMIQYRTQLDSEIKDLIVNDYFKITESMTEKVKHFEEFSGLIEKKQFADKLEDKLPIKNVSVKASKI